jgi:transposase, IS5 family
MRASREQHIPLFRQYSEHSFSDVLKRIDELLRNHPEVCDWVLADLAKGKNACGAKGMTAEQVLRAAILKQLNCSTYRELEFRLVDSMAARAFVCLDFSENYSHSALQANIKTISPATWQRIQLMTVQEAVSRGIESGRKIRIDATAVDANIAHPLDSSLLVDSLRVMDRLVHKLKLLGFKIKLKFSHKRGRKLKLLLLDAKNAEERKPIYEKLILGCGDAWLQLPKLIKLAKDIETSNSKVTRLREGLEKIHSLLEPILAQTIARVLDGQHVEASDKVISIFEEHADIIAKGGREVQFGHKVFFTTGPSNLVLDCYVAEGNPNDADKFTELLDRVRDVFGKYPTQGSFDGGFASLENLEYAKEVGVKDACFSKGMGVEKTEMCKSESVFKKLRNFRAGIESNISCLKRGFGLSRVNWRGAAGFSSCVWSAVIAYNLAIICK